MSASVFPPVEAAVRLERDTPLKERNATTKAPVERELIEKIRHLWAQTLQQDQTDFCEQNDFFEVGGDSISALNLAVVAQEEGISLTVEQIFTFSSLEEMAQAASLSKEQSVNIRDSTAAAPFELLGPQDSLQDQIVLIAQNCDVSAHQIQNAYPCTPMQQTLVAAAAGAENHYVRQLVYEVALDTRLQHLQNAWEATVKANPVLRSRICHLEKYGYVQAVVEEEVAWRTTTGLQQFLKDDSNTPMRLGDPFFRYTIVRDGRASYFVWTIHHALCDGASILELLDEVSLRFGYELPLQRQPYDSFVKSVLASNPQKEESFWRQSLGGIDAAAFPPLPHPGYVANPFSKVKQQVTLDDNLSRFGLTKALLLRAAWAILLSHNTGTEDVTFGAIVNGRNSSAVAGIERMTGPTIGLLPIALHLDPKESVHSFLGRVRNQTAEFMPFEQTGINNIRRYLSGKSTACEFQNLFVVHPASLDEAAAPSLNRLGLKDVSQNGKIEQHSYPLVLQVMLSSGSTASLNIQYDNRVLSGQYARNLGNQLQAVITQLSHAADDTTLDSISPLSDADLIQIREWNKSAPQPENITFHELFRKQVLKTPNAQAVCSIEKSVNYAELDNISSTLAARLIDCGVQTGSYVVVCFEKSIWTVAAMIAVFKAGGAYVPIDPAYPRGRIEEIVNIVQIAVAMVSPSCEAAVQGLCRHILSVDDPPMSYVPRWLGSRSSTVYPTNTAYLLFTSGSTGKPKGVEIPHSALCTSILHHGSAYGAGPDWRTLQFSAHTFDASAAEFFTTLAFGGCICVPSDNDRLNDLAGVITKLSVNTALLTPTVANVFTPEEVPTLKRIILGGEPVTKETLTRWAGSISLTNGYGPSESTIYSGANIGLSVDTNPADIGRSVGSTMWIVNANNHNQLSAIGCPGEIVISGALLAKGYYGEKDLTAANFVSAPQWLKDLQPTSSYDRIYKTGDLARYTLDGTFHIIGRKDSQVKLRGLRIELGEIESRIMELGIATMALSLLPSQGPCGRQIVAAVSQNRLELNNNDGSDIVLAPEQGGEFVEKLHMHLSFTLPEYMVPTQWIVLQRVPLLLSGKVDRKAIKSWVNSMDSNTYKQVTESSNTSGKADILPGSLVDHLRHIWSQVLKFPAEEIGMDTSFFSLGGDSISAIQVVSNAKALGLLTTVRGILSSKTLRNLMKLVQEDSGSTARSFDRLRIPRETDQQFPLSPVQRLFVAANKGGVATTRFNQGLLLRLTRCIPIDLIQKAFAIVVGRHSMLRTIFSPEYDWQKQKPTQHVEEAFRFQYHGHLMSDQVPQIIENGHNSITLESGPLFSVGVFDTIDGIHAFLAAHHLVVDLVSWRIILQDVEDFLATGSFSTPESATFYQWTKFLEATFAHNPVPAMPNNDNQPNVLEFLGFEKSQNTYADSDVVSWTLRPEETRDLLEFSGQQGSAEPVELMIASVANTFTQTFGRVCPTLFVEGHGREPLDTGIDLSNTVGWFTVIYPLVDFPNPNAEFREYVQHVQEGRRSHADNGLGYFSRALLTEESHDELKCKPIQFNYHGKYQQFESDDSLFRLAEFPGLEDTLVGQEIQRTSVFEIEAAIRDGRLNFSLSFPRHLKDTAGVLDWFQGIKQTLTNLEKRLGTEPEPLLPMPVSSYLSPHEFDAYQKDLTAKIDGRSAIKVEDAYLCSPMQQEMMKQQVNNPSVFHLSWEMQISALGTRSVCLDQLARAWQRVVRRHPILRTTFLRSPSTNSPPLQVVLSNVDAEVSTLLPKERNQAMLASLHESLLPHRMWFFQQGNQTFGRLEVNHVVIDGWSLGLIKDDLLAAYTEDLQLGVPYKNFISAHRQTLLERDGSYWSATLRDQPPCLLSLSSAPQSLVRATTSSKAIISLPPLNAKALADFRSQHEITVSSIVSAAWAQTLHMYTQSPQILFGYVVSGRDLEISGVTEIAGPLINVLVHHLQGVSAEENTPRELANLTQEVQAQRVQDSEHVFVNMAEVAGKKFGTEKLFNTAVNFQRRPTALEKNGLRINDLSESKDPWHVSRTSLFTDEAKCFYSSTFWFV